MSRICSECGADQWAMRDAHRLRDALDRKTRDADEMARKVGLLTYKLKDAEARVTAVQSVLQRKIVRQARAVKRLEEKLRARGEKPYEGAAAMEVAPGAEYDAAQRLPGER